jgi:hypothetical protein
MLASGEQLAQVGALVERAIIKPVVDRSPSLAEVQRALEYSQSGRAKGKIVIKVERQWANTRRRSTRLLEARFNGCTMGT